MRIVVQDTLLALFSHEEWGTDRKLLQVHLGIRLFVRQDNKVFHYMASFMTYSCIFANLLVHCFMLKNELLLASICSWLIAQILKSIIDAVQNKRFDPARLIGDGGMPSGHSATVTALATSAALIFGCASTEFAICAIVAVIVMHDASGVRLESGKQAKLINELLEHLHLMIQEKKLKEILGHTPVQVLAGALLGVLVSIVFHFSIMA